MLIRLHTAALLLGIITLLCSPAHLGAQTSPLRLKTVVIDPGHGGKDPGCVRNGVYEKDIVLSVALKLGKMIQDSLPGVNVIYTRSSDKFVELQERAAIANRNSCDIFISIHTNSTKSTQPRGSETFCMGLNMSDDNMEVCQMENSVITLEDDYTSKYEGFDPQSPESYIIFSLLQNSHIEQSLKLAENIQTMYGRGPIEHSRGVRQAGFVVLWRCTSPAVLTELGFMSNDSDFKVLSDRRYHTALARNIFGAVKSYRDSYEFSGDREQSRVAGKEKKETGQTAPKASPSSSSVTYQQNVRKATEDTATEYAIQILSSNKLIPQDDPELKGVECYTIKSSGLYKYLTGHYSSSAKAQQALPGIRTLFPDAFIIPVSK